MNRHAHKFTIADEEAVRTLVAKHLGAGKNEESREKLIRALNDAARHYGDSDLQARQAFFHGLLTGYAVALKLQNSMA